MKLLMLGRKGFLSIGMKGNPLAHLSLLGTLRDYEQLFPLPMLL